MDAPMALSATGLSKGRIEALSDGVFAIAMTLMIFNIKVPEIPNELVHSQIAHEVFLLGPKLLVYFISFVMLGVYWIGHHNQYHYILSTDRPFLWINIFFLFCVSLLPFSAGLLGQYPGERTALAIYGLNLILIGGLLYEHWHYATLGRRLVVRDLHPDVVRMAKSRVLIAPVAAFVAICMATVSTRLSLALFVTIPFLYIIPGRIDRHWLRPPASDSTEESM
jgi:uncharacterized membrane protein